MVKVVRVRGLVDASRVIVGVRVGTRGERGKGVVASFGRKMEGRRSASKTTESASPSNQSRAGSYPHVLSLARTPVVDRQETGASEGRREMLVVCRFLAKELAQYTRIDPENVHRNWMA
jgi:hypothetical protein